MIIIFVLLITISIITEETAAVQHQSNPPDDAEVCVFGVVLRALEDEAQLDRNVRARIEDGAVKTLVQPHVDPNIHQNEEEEEGANQHRRKPRPRVRENENTKTHTQALAREETTAYTRNNTARVRTHTAHTLILCQNKSRQSL